MARYIYAPARAGSGHLLCREYCRVELWSGFLGHHSAKSRNPAVIHVIPLCTGINFGFPADTLLTDHLVLAWVHRWVGRTFLLHSLLHGSLVASSARTSAVTAPPSILPIVVSVVACSSQNALTPSRLYALSSSPCWALGRRSGGVTRRLL